MITIDWNGNRVSVAEDGYYCLTEIAGICGKNPCRWMRLECAKTAIQLVSLASGISPEQLIRTGKNKSKWGHPAIALALAQWCSCGFAQLIIENEQNKAAS